MSEGGGTLSTLGGDQPLVGESVTNAVRIGDVVALEFGDGDTSTPGYVCGDGFVDKRVFLAPAHADFRGCLFTVTPPYQFSAARELEKAEAAGATEAPRLEALRLAASKEADANKAAMAALSGSPVTFGSHVMLEHVSGCVLGILSSHLAAVEKHCTAVALRSQGRPSCLWRVQPRFKHRKLGEPVFFSDQILLVSRKGEQFLRVGTGAIAVHGGLDHLPEVNASPVLASGFRVHCYSAFSASPATLNGGDVVRLRHAESEADLAANTATSSRYPPRLPATVGAPGALQPSVDDVCMTVGDALDTTALWEVELPGRRGGPVQWAQGGEVPTSQPFRLRHVASGRYLAALFANHGLVRAGVGAMSTPTTSCAGVCLKRRPSAKGGLFREPAFAAAPPPTEALAGDDAVAVMLPPTALQDDTDARMATLFQLRATRTESGAAVATDAVAFLRSVRNAPLRLHVPHSLPHFRLPPHTAPSPPPPALEGAVSKLVRPLKFGAPDVHTRGSDFDAVCLSRAPVDVVVAVCNVVSLRATLVAFTATLEDPSPEDFGRLGHAVAALEVFVEEGLKGTLSRQQRQTLCRELGVIDALCEVLQRAFSGGRSLEACTQASSMVRGCQQVYHALITLCANNATNEAHTAFYLPVFIGHVRRTSAVNQLNAEALLASITHGNRVVLALAVSTELIASLVGLLLMQRNPRYVRLLASLCTVDENTVVPSNQEAISEALMAGPVSAHLMVALRPGAGGLEARCAGVAGGRWMPLCTLLGRHPDAGQPSAKEAPTAGAGSDGERGLARLHIPRLGALALPAAAHRMDPQLLTPSTRRQPVPDELESNTAMQEYVVAWFEVLRRCALSRNHIALKWLEAPYPFATLMAGVQDGSLPAAVRAALLRLLAALHVDREPLAPLPLPAYTQVWGRGFSNWLPASPVAACGAHLGGLKDFFVSYFAHGPVTAEDGDKGLCLAVLSCTRFCLACGLFDAFDELCVVLRAVATLVEGAVCTSVVHACCDLLHVALDVLEGSRVTAFFRAFKTSVEDVTAAPVVLEGQEVALWGDLFPEEDAVDLRAVCQPVDIVAALLRLTTGEEVVAKAAFHLLRRMTSTRAAFKSTLLRTQLLVDGAALAAHERLTAGASQLATLSERAEVWLRPGGSEDAVASCIRVLTSLTRFSKRATPASLAEALLLGSPTFSATCSASRVEANQQSLHNLGAQESVLELLRATLPASPSPSVLACLRAAYGFLVAFCVGNDANAAALAPHVLGVFAPHLPLGVGADVLIAFILAGEDARAVPEQLVWDVAAALEHQPSTALVLPYVAALSTGVPNKRTQNLVLAAAGEFLPDTAALLDLAANPGECGTHFAAALLRVVSLAADGRNVLAEAKAKSLLRGEQVVALLQDTTCPRLRGALYEFTLSCFLGFDVAPGSWDALLQVVAAAVPDVGSWSPHEAAATCHHALSLAAAFFTVHGEESAGSSAVAKRLLTAALKAYGSARAKEIQVASATAVLAIEAFLTDSLVDIPPSLHALASQTSPVLVGSTSPGHFRHRVSASMSLLSAAQALHATTDHVTRTFKALVVRLFKDAKVVAELAAEPRALPACYKAVLDGGEEVSFSGLVGGLVALLEGTNRRPTAVCSALRVLRVLVEDSNPATVAPCTEWLEADWAASSDAVMSMQRRLARLGAVRAVCVSLVAFAGREDIKAEALSLAVALTLGGNRAVQTKFLGAMDEAVLGALSADIVLATAAVSKVKPGKPVLLQSHVLPLLRFLQLLCEGHFLKMQNFLRQQPGETHSHNLVLLCCLLLDALSRRLGGLTLPLAEQCVNTLVDFVQGPCSLNQVCLIDVGKVLASCAAVLELSRGGVAALQDGVVVLLLALLEKGEEDGGEPVVDARAAIQSALDVDLLTARMSKLYQAYVNSRVPHLATHRAAAATLLGKSFVLATSDLPVDAFRSGELLAGFNIMVLLYELGLQEESLHQHSVAATFFKQHVEQVEISRGQGRLITRVVFPRPILMAYLTRETKTAFVWEVPRDSPAAKLTALVRAVEPMFEEMKHQWVVSRNLVYATLRRHSDAVNTVAFLVAAVINFCLVRSFAAVPACSEDQCGELPPFAAPFSTDMMVVPAGVWSGGSVLALVTALSWLHVALSLLLFVGFAVSWPLKVNASWKAHLAHGRGLSPLPATTPGAILRHFGPLAAVRAVASSWGCGSPQSVAAIRRPPFLASLWFVAAVTARSAAFAVQDPTAVYRVVYLVASVLGLAASPLWFAFHLCDVVIRVDVVRSVLSAVSSNSRLLLWTLVLATVCVYGFALVGFTSFRDTFRIVTTEGVVESQCEDVLSCFMFTLNHGIRSGGGIGDVLLQPGVGDDDVVGRFAYDLLFFLVVAVVVLNVVLGVIIDGFAARRAVILAKQADMRTTCFVCGQGRQVLEGAPGGFARHVSKEHNMWSYVSFLVHLKLKETTELSGVEAEVWAEYRRGGTEFFPRTALALAGKDAEATGRHKALHVLAEQLSSLHTMVAAQQDTLRFLQRAVAGGGGGGGASLEDVGSPGGQSV